MTSGYFTHVTTLAEVKEQVLKYIPVMARPLVLLREQHPIRWTGVYADIEVGRRLLLFFPISNSPFPPIRELRSQWLRPGLLQIQMSWDEVLKQTSNSSRKRSEPNKTQVPNDRSLWLIGLKKPTKRKIIHVRSFTWWCVRSKLTV